ncbi:translation initiation factor IF-2 [Prevotella histicola]|uniref:translation initiation factor IF-2 n=1 Tax=Prevotella histicola TaxID=470565 RepID=UPI001C5FF72A|nr:translation initiation factor IF-2 [Prevotella histicola]MBW4712917.1 translation initiation factor IF-2 [Prevotella histicola]MBW4877688.1 translation initiation factor IF-2 [Prevotella histicola]MBW4921629.1 translation initiation factor IF-2 [Prevotella histicola]
MSIRLNKAIRELNVGLQTAVEFLEKKPELGEVKSDLNFKLSEEQYKALVGAFKNDQEVKKDAAKLFQKKPKEKKSSGNNHKAEAILDSGRPKYKPVGKIDLDQLNKPTAKKSVAPTEEKSAPEAAAAVSPAKENVVEEQPSTVEKPIAKEEKKPVENKVEEPVKAPVEKKPEAPKAEAPKKEAPVVKTETEPVVKEEPVVEDKKQEDGLFQTKNEKKMLNTPKVNVLGKIDLSSLNQSTRPKKKSKEERRKEREEKAGQNNGQGKKKRVRINKERVDINAAANQQQNQNGKKGGNNGNNKNGGKKNRNRNQKPLEVDDEAVARQVKETLARLTSKSQNKKGAKYRKEKRDAVQERLNAEAKAERKESKILKLTEFVTVSELATMMNVPVTNVISTLMSVGIMVSINQRLDAETINLVADEFDFKTEYVSAEVQEAVSEEVDDENDLVSRAPIVTVMGHVDHGKTSLLDHIRNTNVIAGEAGGITQHIGAYSVTLENGRKVTFLDTPGHEAFTAMRARGAQVTDIVIIIIAADDSVMPTTKEAIAHAQAAGVPMVFAINKIDKPGANPDKIREDLSQMNLLVEEWGGKYQCQEISAKKGLGVNELLDKVLLEADMMDLKANPNRKATGTIIESSLDKGRGYVSTVLVSNGTLKIGDNVIAGTSWGRIKAMFNERNQRIESAGPAEPAIILGLNGAPTAGDTFHVMETEQEAREIANKREQLQREQGLRTQTRLTLSDISHRIARGEFHEMNIIVKGDTDGSIEALSDSFIKLSTEKVKVNVISKAVGQISENDVMLASASDAVIVGFQVRPSADARRLADREGVEINTYSVIYDAIDDVKSTMVGMLDKVKKEIVTGQFEVKQVFKISKVGTVAGGMVTEGKVHSKDKGRVVRDGIVIHTAPIDALKRYKDDVKEVATGLECGISLVNYNDLQVGDIIETFTEIEVEQKL